MAFRRFRITDNQFGIQETNDMSFINLYFDIQDIKELIFQKLSENNKKKYQECQFLPIGCEFHQNDMTYSITIAIAKSPDHFHE